MTHWMINVLRDDQHLSYNEFISRISHALYDGVQERQVFVITDRPSWEADRIHAFVEPSEPVIGSMYKLDMEDLFIL